MNVIAVLIAFSIFTAVYSCYCATIYKSEAQNSKTHLRKPSERPHLHFVDQKQLDELNQSHQHPVLFRLQSSNAEVSRYEALTKHMGITVEEIEKCLPWIPYGNRILISSPDGFSPLLIKRLKHLHTKRDLFLVIEDPSSSESVQRREA